MRPLGERGVVLAQVLITTVILGYIAAMILRMVLQPAMVAANATQSASDAKKAEAAINRVQAAWINGGVCAANTGLGVACSSATCGCTCTVTLAAGVTVTVRSSAGANGSCRLDATP